METLVTETNETLFIIMFHGYIHKLMKTSYATAEEYSWVKLRNQRSGN